MLCFAIYDRIIGLLEISIVYPRHFKFLCMCPKYLEKNTERQQQKFSMCNKVSDRCKLWEYLTGNATSVCEPRYGIIVNINK